MDLPNWINYVSYEDEQTYNYIECIPPGVLNLGGLSHVDEVTNKVISREIDSSEVVSELKKINDETKKNKSFHFNNLVCNSVGSV